MATTDKFYQFSIPDKLKNWLPPDKRKPKMFAFLKALTNSINNLIIQWVSDYKEGVEYPVVLYVYNPATTYAIGDKAVYDEKLYRCIKVATGIIPTNAAYWEYWNPNAIGADERTKYSHLRATLEYALWRRAKFLTTGTVFYSTTPSNSDLYIVTNSFPNNSFVVGADPDQSSAVTDDGSNGFVFDTEIVTTAYAFTINIPLAIYNAMTPKQWATLVDRYNTVGLKYNIQTY